jgi:P4 family phage/plasmid primase-like protien
MSHPSAQPLAQRRRLSSGGRAAAGGGGGGSTTTLGAFLSSHFVRKNAGTAAVGGGTSSSTHTRIPNSGEGVPGGNYSIPDEDYETFMRLYHNHVILGENTEHLTEKQLTNGKGPLVVDLDLHFPLEMTHRVFTDEDVQNLIYEYLAMLKDVVFNLSEDDEFYVFAMTKKKPNPVPEKNMTKDGIHLLFGIQMDQASQAVLRQKMIPVLEDMWGDLGMINSWAEAYDLSVTSGAANWQLYGSCKPKHKTYRVNKVYKFTVDPTDLELMMTQESPTEFVRHFEKFLHLSVRSNVHASLFYRDSFLLMVTAAQATRANRTAAAVPQQPAAGAAAGGGGGAVNGAMITHLTTDFSRLRSKEAVDEALQKLLHNLTPTEYHLQEAYEYTMILPSVYYDSRDKWIRVGWALKNVSESMLIVWIAFSSKSTTKFNYSDIPSLCDQWRSFSSNDLGRLTERSIIYWATNDNPEQAAEVAKNTVGHFIDMTLNSILLSSGGAKIKTMTKAGSDFDIANILLQMFKGIFVCVDIGKQTWYRFENHRWREIDTGDELRLGMSTDLRYMFEKRVTELHNYLSTLEPEDQRFKSSQFRMETAFKIIDRLKCNSDKRNILKECADLFKDRNFLTRLDNTPKLLGCANGVIDFNTNSFRAGLPEDYITKSTQINYVPLSHSKHAAIIPEIEDFMAKIFPVDDLREYMWDHLASTIIGEPSINQTIHFYIGKGSNGKSILTELMKQTMGVDTGSYFIEANVGLITRPRGAPGQASPEIICLKGTRYAVMQEPGQNDVIYEGPMKQLVSGVESLTGRNLFKNEEVFKPQFSVVVCCNEFPAIKTRDKGTWRRVRVVDFLSQFSDKPQPTAEEPYHFLADVTLMERFPVWRETFLAMLVDRAFQTRGKVAACKTVTDATQRYKQREDHLSNYLDDRIAKQVGKRVNKSQINEDFKLWFSNNGDGKLPKLRILHELMDTRFGKIRNNNWNDCKIVEFDAAPMDEDELEQDLNFAEMEDEV